MGKPPVRSSKLTVKARLVDGVPLPTEPSFGMT
jgi:hypothetical protein